MSDTAVAVVAEPTIAVDPAKPVPALAPAVATTEPAKPADPPGYDPSKDPAWVKGRIEEMRRSILKETGFESVEDAKKAAEDAAAAKEAKKTQAEKLRDTEAALKTADAERKELAEAVSVLAKTQMAALTDEQRKAIVDAVGDSPAKQIKLIETLKPTWASSAASAASTVQDTAPGRTAPKDGGATTAPDVKAVYESLKATNPIAASRYALANGIFKNK